jgi:hypothetical protein
MRELDRAQLDGAEPVVFEYKTDPARMFLAAGIPLPASRSR